MNKLKNLKKIIGNTPLIKIIFVFDNRLMNLFFKAEWFNLTGSIKDRIALEIIKNSYKNHTLKKGQLIAEVSSGNTGLSFSAIGAYLGHPVNIIMPSWMSEERKAIIKSYGAKLTLISRKQGGFIECLKRAENLKNQGAFLPLQFENVFNVKAHEISTASEIIKQMKKIKLKVDAVVSGVGTGGTLMGLQKGLIKKFPNLKCYAMEAEESPTITTGKKCGRHKIQGISDEFIPDILNLDLINAVMHIHSDDAILMSQLLAKELGLGVGISSGANFLAGLKVLQNDGFDKNVISVFADDNKKYLSTDYVKNITPHSPEIFNKLKLLGYEIIK